MNMPLLEKNRKSFFVTFIMAILTHLMVLTNRILSEDDYVNLIRSWRDGITLGRLLRPFFQIFAGSKYIINSISGVVGLLFFSATIELVFWIFKVKKTRSKILIAAILIMSPCAFSTMVFPVATGANFIAFFLAFFAFYLIENEEAGLFWSKVFPLFLIVISMMIYQVYATVIIVAFLSKVLIEYLVEKKNIVTKSNFTKLGLMLAGIALYIVLYKLIFYIFSIQPTDYQGFSKVGPRMNIRSLLSAFEKIMQGFCFFWYGVKWNVYSMMNMVFLLLLIVIVARIAWQSKTKVKTMLWAAVMLISMVGACFMLYFTSSKMYYHNLMTWGCCFFYIMVVVLLEKYPNSIVGGFTLAIIASVCLYNYQNGNIGYQQLEVAREKTDYMIQKMMSDIDRISDGNEKIAILGDMGGFDDETYYETNPMISGADEKVKVIQPERFVYYTNVFYGKNYILVDDDELEEISNVVLADKEKYKDIYPYGEYCFKYKNDIVINFGE